MVWYKINRKRSPLPRNSKLRLQYRGNIENDPLVPFKIPQIRK
jgi:hypothetical protein